MQTPGVPVDDLVPIREMMATAEHASDPPPQLLARTLAAKDGEVVVVAIVFCVDYGDGTVSKTFLTQSSGDEELDEIVRSTVEAWRFTPAESSERCSKIVFKLNFQPPKRSRRRSKPGK